MFVPAADGIILNASTKLALGQGVCAPSLTLMATPNKSLMVMGIFDASGAVTGACTLRLPHKQWQLLVSQVVCAANGHAILRLHLHRAAVSAV